MASLSDIQNDFQNTLIKGERGWYHIDQIERDTYDQKQAQKEVDRWVQDIDYLEGDENRLAELAFRQPLDESQQAATDPTASDLAYSREQLEAAEIQLQHTPAVDYIKTRDDLGNMGFIVIDEDTPVQLKPEDNRHPWKVGDYARMTSPGGDSFDGTVTKVTYPDGNVWFTTSGGTSFPLSAGAFRAGYNLVHVTPSFHASGSDIWRRRLPDAPPRSLPKRVDNYIGKDPTLHPNFYNNLTDWPAEWANILADPEHKMTRRYFTTWERIDRVFPANSPSYRLFKEGIRNILDSALRDRVEERLESYFSKNMWTQKYSRRQITGKSTSIFDMKPDKIKAPTETVDVKYHGHSKRIKLHQFTQTPNTDFTLTDCLEIARVNKGCFGVLYRILMDDLYSSVQIGPHEIQQLIFVDQMSGAQCERWILAWRNRATLLAKPFTEDERNMDQWDAVNRRLKILVEREDAAYEPNMETAPDEVWKSRKEFVDAEVLERRGRETALDRAAKEKPKKRKRDDIPMTGIPEVDESVARVNAAFEQRERDAAKKAKTAELEAALDANPTAEQQQVLDDMRALTARSGVLTPHDLTGEETTPRSEIDPDESLFGIPRRNVGKPPALEDEAGFGQGEGGIQYEPPDELSDVLTEESDEDAAIFHRPSRKAAAEGEQLRQLTGLRGQYDTLIREYGNIPYDTRMMTFRDEIDVRIKFVAYELLCMETNLRHLWTVPLEDQRLEDKRQRSLRTVQEIYDTTGGRSPFPWERINRVLQMPEHQVFDVDWDVFQIQSPIEGFTIKPGATFEEVARFYRAAAHNDGDPSIRQDLSNFLEGIVPHAAVRRKRMVEVASRISYNDYVTRTNWLTEKPIPIERKLEHEPPELSDIEESLFALYDIKPPVVVSAVPAAIIPDQPPAVPREAVVLDRIDPGPTLYPKKQNKGWLIAIAVALTFGFLAQGLNAD